MIILTFIITVYFVFYMPYYLKSKNIIKSIKIPLIILLTMIMDMHGQSKKNEKSHI